MAAQDKQKERMARFQELKQKMEDAKKQNRRDVIEEDRKSKLPPNWEAQKAREQKKIEEEKFKEECKKHGEEYMTVKMREWTAEEVERWDGKKKRKKNPDEGFSDYQQAAYRKYQKLSRQLKPDMETYAREKEVLGEEAFYAKVDTLGTMNHIDSQEAIDKMAEDVEKQIARRLKYSRRRAHDEEADIDFINERNMKFNKKLERFYGQYTTEIKQNLERGTAI